MTLPTGLADHCLRMDDSPHARAAIALCHAMAERREAETRAAVVPDRLIDRHAALVISGGYRTQDKRDDDRR